MEARRHLPVLWVCLDDIEDGFKEESLSMLAIEALAVRGQT